MTESHSSSYAAAGVDIEAGYKGVKLMKKHVERTFTPGVLSDIGGFGGLFAPDIAGMKKPVLVSGTDGVGTKQRLAQLMGKHDTVGIDCVAMCVNDIVCCGAKPIFFLDYIAIGKNIPEKVAELVSGVAEGCVQAGCALIGGETAEHPGTMAPDDYDLAGFSVGIVDEEKILDQKRMQAGDAVIALPSSGIHSNGYSLVRKVVDVEHPDLGTVIPELGAPPRCIPDGLGAVIEKAAVRTPAVFRVLQEAGNIPERDMFNTFNMGVGMTMIVRPDTAEAALAALRAQGVDAYVIGEVRASEEKVALC